MSFTDKNNIHNNDISIQGNAMSIENKNVVDNNFYKHLHDIFGTDDIFDKFFKDIENKVYICHSTGLDCLNTDEKYCKFFLWYSKECFRKGKNNNGNAAIHKVFDLIHHRDMPSIMPILHHYVKLVPSPLPLSPTLLDIYDENNATTSNDCDTEVHNIIDHNDNDNYSIGNDDDADSEILTQVIPLDNE